MSLRSDLRAHVFDRSAGHCEWPHCPNRATQLAHLHSIGIGGRKSADTLTNVAALCDLHAAVTDGGSTLTLNVYLREVRGLPGLEDAAAGQPGLGWLIADTLTRMLSEAIVCGTSRRNL